MIDPTELAARFPELRLVRADGTLTRTCERLLDAMEGHA